MKADDFAGIWTARPKAERRLHGKAEALFRVDSEGVRGGRVERPAVQLNAGKKEVRKKEECA